ncbi:MAG: NifU family protein [Nostocoides sp.]
MSADAAGSTVRLPEDRDLDDLAGRLDKALARVDDLDPDTAAVAKEALAAHNDLHRAALVHLVRALRTDTTARDALLDAVGDPVISAVLLSHGIIRTDPQTQAERVLERIRPEVSSHGGQVELDRVEDGTAYIRLAGACTGCSSVATTLRSAIEDALLTEVAGVTSVHVLPSDPGPTLIPLSAIGRRPATDQPEPGWAKALAVAELPATGMVPVRPQTEDGASVDAVVVNLDGRLAAYVNACAHQGRRLDDGLLDPEEGTLTCAGHGFTFDAASGECLTLPGAQLDPVPLRVDDGHVWLRVHT